MASFKTVSDQSQAHVFGSRGAATRARRDYEGADNYVCGSRFETYLAHEGPGFVIRVHNDYVGDGWLAKESV